MLDEESRDLTTFSEGISLYRFKRLPFGLSCSASIFVRQLQGALAPVLKQRWVKSYLDDVIVCATSFDCLVQRRGQVFEQTEEVGIKLNLSKCHIGQQEIKFWGNVVSKNGIKPDPENVEAVEKMQPPTNVKETRRFLVMAGFYRKHIEKLSALAAPLTDLTRKNKPFERDDAC